MTGLPPRVTGRRVGLLGGSFDPAHAGNAGAFSREVARISAASRSLAPLPGLASAELPGSLEWEREQAWAVEGIPLSEEHLSLLKGLGREYNLPLPW